MTGDYDAAEAAYRELCDAYRESAGPIADDFLVGALFAIRQAQGRLPEFVDAMRERHENSSLDWTPVLAACLVEAGEIAEARVLLSRMRPLRRNWHWLARTTCAAWAAMGTDDVQRAGELYPLLLPHRDQIISAVVGCPYRPAAHVLGQLARFLGRADEAQAHLERALHIAQACHNRTWIARIREDLATPGRR
jgi:tetratricopeptide (TPR) repeat protein